MAPALRKLSVKESPPPSMMPAARGQRVRARMLQLGWRQKRLAEQLGISDSHLSKLLKGRPVQIDPVMAWRMARVLGLTELYILYGNRQGLPDAVLRALPPPEE